MLNLKWSLLVFFSCTLILSVGQAQPTGFQTLEIGSTIPQFNLPGVDGKTYTVDSFSDDPLIMVLFTCNHCPTAQAYEDRVKQLHADYKDKGVGLVAISPNDPLAVRLDELGYSDLGDSFEDMKIRAKETGFEFPYLYDGETQATSLAFGVLATPHVFIFDKDRKLRYKGRLDDSEVGTVQSHDARNALDALLAGRPVVEEVTRVFGCSTKWNDKRLSAKQSIEKWDQEKVELALLNETDLRTLAENKTDKFRLINVWATWCVPCVGELPEFVTLNRMYRGRNFEMITLSADDPKNQAPVLKKLTELHVACTNYLFDSADRDKLFDGLDPKWEGAVPFTVLIAPGGEVVYRKHGEINVAELKHEIADHLGRTYAVKVEPANDPPAMETKDDTNTTSAANIPVNFQKQKLIAWCIVPFDARNRGPAERTEMVKRLGLKRVAYDWREKHVAEFEEEILQYQQQGIEFFAFWQWHDAIEPLIKKYGIHPQIWHPLEAPDEGSQAEKVKLAAEKLLPIVEKANSLGLKLGIYNHGGWNGQPENMIEVCEHLRKNHHAENVGIVYNFHHGHEDAAEFATTFTKLKPYLLCVNLNGMVDVKDFEPNTNKILPIGSGVHEAAMIRTIIGSGYEGPIGVLGHREELDAEESLRLNLDGLEKLLKSF